MSEPPSGSRAPQQWSADGQWWWDGDRWLPAAEVRASKGRIQNTKAWPWIVIGLIGAEPQDGAVRPSLRRVSTQKDRASELYD